MDSNKEEVVSILRSCLITNKNGSLLDNLNKDYKMLEGKNIPFKQLGFSTLEAFVTDIPGIRILRRGRDIWVEAIPTQETAHISRLIAGQKQSSSRRKKSRHYAPPPARRPKAMSAYKNMRSADTGYHARRTGGNQNLRNTSNRVTISPQPVTIYPPKPLMQQLIQPPILSPVAPIPTRPRYTIPNGAAMASPRKPLDQQSAINSSSALPQNPKESLKNVAQQLDLPEPVYKIFPFIGTHNGDKKVYAQVQVGAAKFSSYPSEVRTDIEAEMLAAEQALNALKLQHGEAITLPLTTNQSLIKQRILAIINQHNGIFIDKIQSYYQEEYKEKLPINWAKDAEKWSEITAEKGVNNTTILHRYVASAEPIPEPTTPKGDKVRLNPIGRVEPGPVQLPEEHVYIVYVTTVVSPLEIWIRLYGDKYSKQFDIITAEMTEHYKNMSCSGIDNVKIGAYCAIKDDDSWHRVQVVDCDNVSGLAEVFFIDLGEYDTVSVNRLILLDKKFCLLSAQATKVSLAGLEEFPDCNTVFEHLEEELMDRVFYIESLSRDEDDDGRIVTNAVFYDTSGPEDVNVNETISKKIIKKLISNVPTLKDERRLTEVHLSHAESNAGVYVQVKSDGMKFLVNMLNKLINTGMTEDELKKSALRSIDSTKIYLTRCLNTGNWYRAKIVGVVPTKVNTSHRCKMFLIDFGQTIIVDAKDILELGILCDVLTKLPPQALHVQLQNIEPLMFTDKMVARLKELAPPNEMLLVRVVKPRCKDSPPVIDLFKRIQPDNALVSINNTLALESELSKFDGDGNNNVRPRKRVERTNSRVNVESEEIAKSLKPPRIADIGEYFDVHVTMAASPSNFTVQPHEYIGALADMMGKLQEACSKYTGPQPTIESIREGRLFAAKHNDDIWYRVCISNVLDEYSVTVYFCDFGDVTLITLDKLQPLTTQFLELPYQAIKARLVGIKPVNIDWSADDSWYFQNLVVNRNYVSIIVESGPDEHSPGNNVLGLKLIDVSTDVDVYIARQLVEEGRATFVD